MARKSKLKGWEWDAFTGWRRYIKWRAGERKSLKRGINRRERRKARQAKADAA